MGRGFTPPNGKQSASSKPHRQSAIIFYKFTWFDRMFVIVKLSVLLSPTTYFISKLIIYISWTSSSRAVTRIPLNLSYHTFLSSIALGGSSWRHPVSARNWWIWTPVPDDGKLFWRVSWQASIKLIVVRCRRNLPEIANQSTVADIASCYSHLLSGLLSSFFCCFSSFFFFV